MGNIENAIKQLYVAFSDAPKPSKIEACPCCLDQKEINRLLDCPLRELSPDHLSTYASSVFLTVGSEADFFYFLPRILEVSAADASWWPSPEVIGRSIHMAHPEAWPSCRLDALMSFLNELVYSIIQSGEHYCLDDWLCGIARMGFDVRPFLRQVSQSEAA